MTARYVSLEIGLNKHDVTGDPIIALVNVEVLPGKRLILSNPATGRRVGLATGTKAEGVVSEINAVPWVTFSGHDAGIEVTRLKQLWDDMIVEVTRNNDGREEDFFT